VLHKNIIPIEYGDDESGAKQLGSMHSHLKSTGPFITPTDICTLMLYTPSAGWEWHYVMSKKYISIWNCKENSLLILTQKAWKQIQSHQDSKD
jgi:uncharacterized protein YmfQ (DUF2313 family)